MQSMGKHSPKITKSGLKSTLKEKDFDKFLDPKKKKHFELIKKFYDTALLLTEFSECRSINLLRYTDGFIIESGKVELNYHLFSE